MALAVGDPAVTGDDDVGGGHGHVDVLFAHGERDYGRAFFAVDFERLFVQALAGFDEHDVLVIDVEVFAEAGVEDGRFELGHAGDVGIGFVGDVDAAGFGAADHGEAEFEGAAGTGV